jgi:hypothetical protein
MYTGDCCLLHDDQFQTFYDQMHVSSYDSDAMVIEGGNATSIRGVYLSQTTQGFAGLRVWRMAGIYDTTGKDAGWMWAIFGGFPRWPTGSGTETLRAGSTTTRLRLAASNPFTPAFLSGFSVVSNTGQERRVKIGGNDGTDGNYVDVTSAFSTIPTTVYFKDPYCPTATGRRPDISMNGHCNLEIPKHCAIKFAHEASFYARNGLFYTYEGNDYDTVFWCRDNRVASGYGVQIEGYTTYNEEGIEATRRLSRDIACEGSLANYRLGMPKGDIATLRTGETVPRYVNARTGALVNVTMI